MKRSDLCDFNDVYIVVKGNVTVNKKTFTDDDFEAPNNIADNATATNTANNNALGEKKLVFKNNAQCIDVMPMYNLLEYSKNYKETTRRFRNYYRDEPNSSTDDNNITHSILNSKSFDCKTNFMENRVTNNNLTKNVKIVVPLKNLSNFWRNLNILINCEVGLILTWFKNCVLIDKSSRDPNYNAYHIVYEIDNPEDAIF